MNPTATARFRRATSVLAIAWAVLALALSLYSNAERALEPGPPLILSGILGDYWIVQWATPSAIEAGIEVGDHLLEIDDQPVHEWMRARGRNFREGVPNAYLVDKRDGNTLRVPLLPSRQGMRHSPMRWMVDIGLPLIGLAYIAIGLSVWWRRSERVEAWALLLFCSSIAAGLFGTGWSVGSARFLQWLTLPLIGATTFHLFTTYPMEPDWAVRHPRVRVVPYVLAIALGALAALESFVEVPPGGYQRAAFGFTVGIGFFCLGLLCVERWRSHESQTTDRADVMLMAAMISFLPVLLLLVAQVFLHASLPWFLAFLSFALFPIAVAYGIVRTQLFDIRLIARSSAAYGATTLAITGLFAFLITFADAAVSRFNVNARSPWFSVAFLFFAILFFNPLRERLQSFVDRFFDRDHATYRRAVREISEAMVSMLSIKEIVDRILVAATDTMGLERAMVLLVDDERRLLLPSASRGDWDPSALSFQLPADHPILKQLWMRRHTLSRVDFDDESDPEVRDVCRDVFDTLEIELLVPILFGVDLLGAIAVGRKLTMDRLVADDRQLLRTLANQSAIAIENAKAYDEIAQLNETLELRVDERTQELRETQEQLMQAEKMKSLGQLVAGVAHELNNPIAFIHANIQLVDEQVRKLIDAQQRGDQTERTRETLQKLLVRSREGTERVKQIVQDLRTFSRMDQAALQDVDLHQELDRTLALMEPRCKDCIAIERDYGDIPRIRCYPGQLNQVFMNLLINACDALEGSGEIRIKSSTVPSGVRLEFHDNGPGVPPEIRSRIFDPFFTTKPVGRGTGLGLSLAHGIVERHGGRLWVESEIGRGTRFIIELPLDATLANP